MAVKGSANDAATKWKNNLRGKWSAIQQGVDRVTDPPGAAAAAAEAKWWAKVENAHTTGKWRSRVASVSLADWKAAFHRTGQGTAFQSAGDAAMDKVDSFMGELIPYIETGQRQLDTAVPDTGTIDSAAERAAWWVRYMSGFSRGG